MGLRSHVTRKESPPRMRRELELAPAPATIKASIMAGELASVASFGHVAVMDAHNASCQRALLSTRLLNLGVRAFISPGSRYALLA